MQPTNTRNMSSSTQPAARVPVRQSKSKKEKTSTRFRIRCANVARSVPARPGSSSPRSSPWVLAPVSA